MAVKPNKSILKRIRVTKTGKILRRKAHHNHFNAKESRTLQHRQAKTAEFSKAFQRQIRKVI
ncbi:MAG: hypothetical protein A2676_04940 [Candidatus Sungbacteria bacterium RIFCSPHIGHO2_01_FULL_51_22]|nr:MAG: hypothetical protein A2676_04940 [Candidatus Sungbacteria bacterium RIFCSPHIGHO2_01_FULL_51_22]